jgi:hypothetical protein
MSEPNADYELLTRRLERLIEIGNEDWKTPGHPMNSWVSKDSVNQAAREALGAWRRIQNAQIDGPVTAEERAAADAEEDSDDDVWYPTRRTQGDGSK